MATNYSSTPSDFINNEVAIKTPYRQPNRSFRKLYGYQDQLIAKYQSNNRTIVHNTRQSGVTTATWAYVLWYSIYNSDKNILITSTTVDSARSIMVNIRNALESMSDELTPKITTFNRDKVAFSNGSSISIVAATANVVRGETISLLWCDDFAFYNKQNEFWDNVTPALGISSKVIITSCFGITTSEDNLFVQMLHDAASPQNQYAVPMNVMSHVVIPWDAPPNRNNLFKESMIANLGIENWLTEYEGKLVTIDD
jgi:hypothetical protein